MVARLGEGCLITTRGFPGGNPECPCYNPGAFAKQQLEMEGCLLAVFGFNIYCYNEDYTWAFFGIRSNLSQLCAANREKISFFGNGNHLENCNLTPELIVFFPPESD